MSGQPLVIKLGGGALNEPDKRAELWDALARLAREAQDGMVIVHGGGLAVDAYLARLGMRSERKAGLRVTLDEQIGEVVAVLRGRVNSQLVGLLCARGIPAIGLGLSDGGACVCVKHEPDGIDLGRVGRVVLQRQEADAPGKAWRDLLDCGFVPVLCSIGFDACGQPLNINADDAALSVVRILSASVLLMLTDVPGILDGDGALRSETNAPDIEGLIRSGAITGGMIPKARAASACAEKSGVPTVIASWRDADQLVGLASGASVGTRVLPVCRDTRCNH